MRALKLNLGCGYRQHPEFVNIDMSPECEPDLCINVLNGLPYKDNSVDEVWAIDFLEHIPLGRTHWMIEEIYRVLKPNGKFLSLTPSTDGRGAFQDPTHLSFWNRNSWMYYTEDEYRDMYSTKAKFTGYLQDVNLAMEVHNIIHTLCDFRAVKTSIPPRKKPKKDATGKQLEFVNVVVKGLEPLKRKVEKEYAKAAKKSKK